MKITPRSFLANKSVEEILEKLKAFKNNLELDNNSVADFKNQISDIILGYSTTNYRINPGGVIVRGRINCGRCLFPEVQQLWYPPKKYITSLGRCNDINEQLFYCATKPETILKELKPNESDWFTVLECDTPNQDWETLMPIGINALQQVNAELEQIFKDHFSNNSFTKDKSTRKKT